MKLDEVLQLDELSLRDAVKYGVKGATALVGTAMLAGSVYNSANKAHDVSTVAAEPQQLTAKVEQSAERQVKLASLVTKKYDIKADEAWKIVDLAIKHEASTFPKAEDILAIIGIESSFNSKAKSQLKTDPAIGLMQVRPGVWGIDPNELSSPEDQIEKGVEILKSYYQKLGKIESAVHAYNVGITTFKKGIKLNPKYVSKFETERSLYALKEELIEA